MLVYGGKNGSVNNKVMAKKMCGHVIIEAVRGSNLFGNQVSYTLDGRSQQSFDKLRIR